MDFITQQTYLRSHHQQCWSRKNHHMGDKYLDPNHDIRPISSISYAYEYIWYISIFLICYILIYHDITPIFLGDTGYTLPSLPRPAACQASTNGSGHPLRWLRRRWSSPESAGKTADLTNESLPGLFFFATKSRWLINPWWVEPRFRIGGVQQHESHAFILWNPVMSAIDW